MIIPLAAWPWPLAATLATALATALALARPGVLLGLALNGFFVYLGILDLSGRAPRTLISGPYYVVLGSLLLFAAWRGREVAFHRLRSQAWVARSWACVAGLLASWFLLNGLLYRAGGSESLRLMALLVLASLPAAILISTFEAPQLEDLRRTVIGLGVVFTAAAIAAIMAGREVVVGRFSPIAHLDPISAGLVPAVAATAALASLPVGRRGRMTVAVLIAVLGAACAAAGSRGPLLAFVGTAFGALFLVGRRSLVTLCLALGLGLVVVGAATEALGTSQYLTQGLHDVIYGTGGDRGGPISTIRIRIEWARDALRAAPNRPLLGHGIAALPDTTPEARRLHVYGELRYPHNDLIESIYSLGVIGLALFLGMIGLVVAAIVRLLPARRSPPIQLAILLFVFFFLGSNFSGEIGADSGLWAACALVVSLAADPLALRGIRSR